ncbi:MAG: alcohol dehydrogenase family protein [Gammaproteobacteria bacterium]|nr:alcohol dehydrogenase family protein [Gammaproteobacteria bacterium]
MQAMVLKGHGGLEQLEFHDDWPIPEVKDREVLIQVAACGLNNTDVNTRSGWYSKAVTEATTGDAYKTVDKDDPAWGGSPIRFPRIQGADICGYVTAVGSKSNPNLIGQRVISDNWLRDWSNPGAIDQVGYLGSECNGGFAQYVALDERNVEVVQSEFSDAELATFSCSYTTAEGMLSRAEVTNKDTVLVTGASGGVGSALIQLAKRRGAKVVGLASDHKHAQLALLGADALLPRNPEDLETALEQAIGIKTVSVVADIVGGSSFKAHIDVLASGGRYTCSGAIGGPMVELDLRTLYLRDLTFTGSTVTPRHTFSDIVSYIERGEIKPLVAATFPLQDLHAAQQMFIDKQHVGNIVVTMNGV